MGASLGLEDGEEIIHEVKGSDLEGNNFGEMVVGITLVVLIITAPLGILLLIYASQRKSNTHYFITNKRVVKDQGKMLGSEREEARYSEIEDYYLDKEAYGPWEHNKSGKIGLTLRSGKTIKLEGLPDAKEVENYIKHNL